MTLRELVACVSPLPDGNTVRDHLAATDCITIGGGTYFVTQGAFVVTPADQVQLDSGSGDTLISETKILLTSKPTTLISQSKGEICGI